MAGMRYGAPGALALVASIMMAGTALCQTPDAVSIDEVSAVPPEQASPGPQRWTVLPVIASTPETGLQLGIMFIRYLHALPSGAESSSVDFIAYYTTREQYVVSVMPNIYLAGGDYRLAAVLKADYWPANFYGIGNDSRPDAEQYESTEASCDIVAERCFSGPWLAGVSARIHTETVEIEDGGILDAQGIPGSADGNYVGVGLRAGYDSRDNRNAPRSGNLLKYGGMVYDAAIGSDLGFTTQTVDVRHYVPVGRASTLALAARLRTSRGDVPFRYLSTPDGSSILRGIEKGRYVDRDMLALQSEFRFPLGGEASLSGMTVFVEFAQVAGSLDEFRDDAFKLAAGLGYRYSMNPGERVNIRVDVGWVDDTVGLVLELREAF
jgi:hypothetical protein